MNILCVIMLASIRIPFEQADLSILLGLTLLFFIDMNLLFLHLNSWNNLFAQCCWVDFGSCYAKIEGFGMNSLDFYYDSYTCGT